VQFQVTFAWKAIDVKEKKNRCSDDFVDGQDNPLLYRAVVMTACMMSWRGIVASWCWSSKKLESSPPKTEIKSPILLKRLTKQHLGCQLVYPLSKNQMKNEK
jgi:hypothetical protein